MSAALSLLSAPATAIGWQPLVTLSRRAVLGLFGKLQVGTLDLQDVDGTRHRFGDPTLVRAKHSRSAPATATTSSGSKQLDGPPRAELIVRSDTFWVRMLVGADLGFAESYMSGEVDTPDLGEVFSLFIHNRKALGEMQVGLVSNASAWLQSVLNRRYANTRGGSLKNIGAHYDISNVMYEAFLSADMTYSCAVFPSLDSDLTGPLLASNLASAKLAGEATSNGHAPTGATRAVGYSVDGPGGPTPPDAPVEDELEAAQLTKLRLHIERANIRKGDRVLEIGTGWGSLAMEAVRRTGCTVDSLTLSIEQKALAEARIAAAGMSGSIRVHLLDYRDMPEAWTDSFDRVVSIEMLEAVGIEFLPTYFACIDRVLKREGGAAVFQCITMPETRFDAYIHQVDFIKKWIFPGGVLPSVTSLVDAVTKGSKGTLILDTCHSIGPHYARTLREWRNRFEAAFDDVIRPALLRDHEAIRLLSAEAQDREVDVFRKKWLYYFIYCEVGFTERVIGDHILSFTRERNTTLPVCCG